MANNVLNTVSVDLFLRQQALNHTGQILGHELNALGSAPDTTKPQNNPYNNPFGHGIFGPAPNANRSANQPYGSTTHTPTAEVAQPNAAERARHQTTAHIIAQQHHENIFERGWHDVEHGFASVGHRLEARWEADKAFIDFELSPDKREASTLDNFFDAEVNSPQARRTAAEAMLVFDDGMDDNLGPEFVTSSSFGNGFRNPLHQPLWKSNPSLMFNEKGEGEKPPSASRTDYLRKPKLSSLKQLKQFGLNRLQRKMFYQGKQVIFEDPSTKYPTATIFQLKDQVLSAGIYDVVGDSPGALTGFLSRSRALAESMNVKNLDLYGADVQNDRLMNILSSRGFSSGEPVKIDSFGFDMEVPTVRKVYNLGLEPGHEDYYRPGL